MSFLDIAKKRYTVRSYTSQKVEQDKLDQILEAAHVAPTGANCQPQHLIVVQSEEGLAKIGKAPTFTERRLLLLCAAIMMKLGSGLLTARS